MAASDLSPMQKELLGRADSVLSSIRDTVNSGVDIAKEQLPDIAQQYVMFGRAIFTTYEFIGLAFFAIGTYLLVRVAIFNSYKSESSYGWSDSRYAASLFGGFGIFIGLTIMLSWMSQFLMVWFAPKIWLITEIVKLVK